MMMGDVVKLPTKKPAVADDLLSLFQGYCGHTWVGATAGSFACPVCGVHDGDHNLRAVEPIAVQPEDYGCRAWETLERVSNAAYEAGMAEWKAASDAGETDS
jgi:hypothetical protein